MGAYPGIGVLSTGANIPWNLDVSSLGGWGTIQDSFNPSPAIRAISSGPTRWGAPAATAIASVAGANRYAMSLSTDGTLRQRRVFSGDTALTGFTNSDFVSIASAGDHTAVLKDNGDVLIFDADGEFSAVSVSRVSGMDISGDRFVAMRTVAGVKAIAERNLSSDTFTNPDPLPHLLVGSVKDVAAFTDGGCALKTDGTVEAWGANGDRQATVPPGLTGVIAIEAGRAHVLALKADGTVIAWGANAAQQSTVPAGLSGVVEIAAEGDRSLALKSDGTVVTWGQAWAADADVPSRLVGVTSISAGGDAAFSVRGQPLSLTGGVVGQPYSGTVPRRLAMATFTATGLPPGLTLTPAGALTGTPTIAGVYPVTFQEQNRVLTGSPPILTFTRVHTRTSTVTMTITMTAADAFLAWQRAQPAWATGPLPPEAAAEADADNDGLANLLEFAFGSDPLAPSANPVQSQLLPGAVPNEENFTFTVSVPVARLPHVVLQAEFSDTLDFAGATVYPLTPIAGASSGNQLLTCSEAQGTKQRRFARIVARFSGS